MKKQLNLLLLLLAILLVGCTSSTNNLDKVFQIVAKTDYLTIGDVVQLTTNIDKLIENPDLYTHEDVSWASSNENIAKVTDGVVEALTDGDVEITASVGTLSAKKQFTIRKHPSLSTISIRGTQTLTVGQTTKLTATLNNASGAVLWETSNHQIATVDSSGLVSAVGGGLVTIHATLKDNKDVFASYPIYVKTSSTDPTQNQNINEIIKIIYEMQGELDFTYLNQTIVGLVDRTKDSVVGVSNYEWITSGGKQSLSRMSVGTGGIINRVAVGTEYEYTVITNQHVIEDADEVRIYFGYEDREVVGEVVRFSEEFDLALVRFRDSKLYTVLEFAEVDSFETGDFVVAMGNSNGYEFFGTVTFGVISYKDRLLEGEAAEFIQHDAAINPGNSGGPLFDLQGKIIGINTLKMSSLSIDNMGFSVSIKTVKEFIG